MAGVHHLVGTTGRQAQCVAVVLGLVNRQGQGRAAHHQLGAVVEPPVATHRHTEGVNVDPEHGIRSALFAHARLVRLTCEQRRFGLHQPTDLRRFLRKVVLHQQPAQALQHGQHVDQLSVIAGGAQPLRHPTGHQHPFQQGGQLRHMGVGQRPRPGLEHLRGPPHAVQTQHGDGAPHRQDGPIATAQCAAHAPAIDIAQHLKTQAHISEHHLGQLGHALAVHAYQARCACRATRHAGQQAGAAHPVDQQHQRAFAAFTIALEPARQRPLQGARAAVALALLPISGAVDDGTQRLGNRLPPGARQTHHVTAQRCHLLGREHQIRLSQRRAAAQAVVQGQAKAQ